MTDPLLINLSLQKYRQYRAEMSRTYPAPLNDSGMIRYPEPTNSTASSTTQLQMPASGQDMRTSFDAQNKRKKRIFYTPSLCPAATQNKFYLLSLYFITHFPRPECAFADSAKQQQSIELPYRRALPVACRHAYRGHLPLLRLITHQPARQGLAQTQAGTAARGRVLRGVQQHSSAATSLQRAPQPLKEK